MKTVFVAVGSLFLSNVFAVETVEAEFCVKNDFLQRYKSESPISFNTAEAKCEALGGTLTSMKDEEERQILADHGTLGWVGVVGSGLDVNTYEFIDGVDSSFLHSTRGLLPWAPNQPNEDVAEACAAMSVNDGLLYDYACNTFNFYYNCRFVKGCFNETLAPTFAPTDSPTSPTTQAPTDADGGNGGGNTDEMYLIIIIIFLLIICISALCICCRYKHKKECRKSKAILMSKDDCEAPPADECKTKKDDKHKKDDKKKKPKKDCKEDKKDCDDDFLQKEHHEKKKAMESML